MERNGIKVDPGLKEAVLGSLRRIDIRDTKPDMRLAEDLGMDSQEVVSVACDLQNVAGVKINRPTPACSFAEDVRLGLLSSPKRLLAKYLYDDLGSSLFEAITLLPEYYLTRAEFEILERDALRIVDAFGGPMTLIELGAGNGAKARLLIEAALRRQQELHYIPIDISQKALSGLSSTLHPFSKRLIVTEHVDDYWDVLRTASLRTTERALVLFLGSSIGNYAPTEAAELVRLISQRFPDGSLLLGTDLKKERNVIELAYDDPIGVTSCFNKNLLARINHELGGAFDLTTFRHVALYDERGCVDSYLESNRKQQVKIDKLNIELQFERGERIHTESSYKYDPADVANLALGTGFDVRDWWDDAHGRYRLTLFGRLRSRATLEGRTRGMHLNSSSDAAPTSRVVSKISLPSRRFVLPPKATSTVSADARAEDTARHPPILSFEPDERGRLPSIFDYADPRSGQGLSLALHPASGRELTVIRFGEAFEQILSGDVTTRVGPKYAITGNGLREAHPDYADLLSMDAEENGMPTDLKTMRNVMIRVIKNGFQANVENIGSVAMTIAKNLRFSGQDEIDLIAAYCKPVVWRGITDNLGVDYDRAPEIDSFVNDALSVNKDRESRDTILSGWHRLYRFCDALISEKRSSPDDSVFSQLVSGLDTELRKYDEALAHKKVLHACATYVSGVPTDTLLARTLYELLSHPELIQECLLDPSKWSAAIQEIRRDVVHFATLNVRRLKTDVTLKYGYELHAGQHVLPSIKARLHDETMIAQPNLLDITHPVINAEFGRGDHFCPAAGPSRKRQALWVRTLFEINPDLRLAAPHHRVSWSAGLLPTPDSIIVLIRCGDTTPCAASRDGRQELNTPA